MLVFLARSPQYCERCGKDDDDYPSMKTLASDPTKHAEFEGAVVSIVRESSCAALREVTSISIVDVWSNKNNNNNIPMGSIRGASVSAQ